MATQNQVVSVVLAVLVVASGLAFVPSATATEVVAIDYNHDLDSEESIEQYQQTGAVSEQIVAPSMQLTIADKREDVDRGSVILDSDTYLRVQYHEDVERSVRIYIPEEYWEPFEDQNVRSLDGNVDAEMEPVRVNGKDYSAVTLHFSGQTDTVIAIDGVEDGLWNIRHEATEMLNSTVPFELPSLSAPEENPWQMVDSSDIASGSYDTDSKDVMVEYDKTPDEDEITWVEAPSCDSDEPVCKMDRSGNVTIVTDDADDPPAIRYKTDPTMRDNIKTGVRRIRTEVDGIVDDILGVFE